MTKYSLALRILHWSIAALILGLIALGYYMSDLKGSAPVRGDLYAVHKSLGVAVIVLVCLRILLRISQRTPPLPSGMPMFEKRAAHAAHILLYCGMIAVPISGLVMSMAGGHGVAFFGLPLPNLMNPDRALAQMGRQAHELLPYLLLGIIALHVGGALKHRLFDTPENDVLPRMGWPERSARSRSDHKG